MASLQSMLDSYMAEYHADAPAEERRAVEEAYFAGALVVLKQVENPSKSFAAQRRKLRSLASEIYRYAAMMAGR